MRLSKYFINPEENRPRMFWRIAGQVLIMVLLFLMTGAVLTNIYLMTHEAETVDYQQLTSYVSHNPEILLLNVVLSTIAVLLSLWIAIRFLDKRSFSEYGLVISGRWWKQFLFGLGLGALLMTLIFLVQLVAGFITVSDFFTSNVEYPLGVAMLIPVLITLLVGFYEELLLRGYYLTNFAQGFRGLFGKRGSVWFALVLSSLIFGVGHILNAEATIMSAMNISLMGVVLLGVGYVLTGSLAIPIGIHISWNYFQGAVFGFPVSGTGLNAVSFIKVEQHGPSLLTGGQFGPEAGLIGLAATILGGLIILWYVRRQKGEGSIDTRIAEAS